MTNQPTWHEVNDPDFNPDTHCRYTGRRLWTFPDIVNGLMFWYREPDARVTKCRRLTPDEIQQLRKNPKQSRKEILEFKKGIDFARKQNQPIK